jgi:hypothetical protein
MAVPTARAACHGGQIVLCIEGLNLKDGSETLGHSRIVVTVNLYGYMHDERRREIADRMDEILRAIG